jgi:polygalacturonase
MAMSLMATERHTGTGKAQTVELASKPLFYSYSSHNPADFYRPDHFIVLKDMTNGHISNLNIQNWPVHCFDVIGADGLTITGLTLDNSAGNEPNSASGDKAAAHNSDGFDFSSCLNVVLSNTVVKNQDDCVAVTSGTNITITGMTCSGGQ